MPDSESVAHRKRRNNVTFRLTPKMRAWLDERANRHGCSFSAEVESILEQGLKAEKEEVAKFMPPLSAALAAWRSANQAKPNASMQALDKAQANRQGLPWGDYKPVEQTSGFNPC